MGKPNKTTLAMRYVLREKKNIDKQYYWSDRARKYNGKGPDGEDAKAEEKACIARGMAKFKEHILQMRPHEYNSVDQITDEQAMSIERDLVKELKLKIAEKETNLETANVDAIAKAVFDEAMENGKAIKARMDARQKAIEIQKESNENESSEDDSDVGSLAGNDPEETADSHASYDPGETANLKAIIQRLTTEVEVSKVELEESKAALEAKEEEIAELKTELSNAKAKVSKPDSRANDFSVPKAKLEATIATLEEALRSDDVSVFLLNKLNETKTALEEKEEENVRLAMELADSQAKNANLESQVKKFTENKALGEKVAVPAATLDICDSSSNSSEDDLEEAKVAAKIFQELVVSDATEDEALGQKVAIPAAAMDICYSSSNSSEDSGDDLEELAKDKEAKVAAKKLQELVVSDATDEDEALGQKVAASNEFNAMMAEYEFSSNSEDKSEDSSLEFSDPDASDVSDEEPRTGGKYRGRVQKNSKDFRIKL